MDLIDREELLDALHNRLCHPKTPEQSSGIAAAEKLVKKQPAIQPKRGEWIKETEVKYCGIATFTLVKCSCCGQWALKEIHNSIRKLGEVSLHRCPYCDAEMRGKGNKGTNSHEIQKTTTERN